MAKAQLQHFYISEEQSIYLLKADDARKLKAWTRLCRQQLHKLGYQDIEFIGKGAYGFVFCGQIKGQPEHVFKFSRMTLPPAVQQRLEEEAYMLGQLSHPNIPGAIDYAKVGRQNILVMERGPGIELDQYYLRYGALSTEHILNIARQLADVLLYLRHDCERPIVHGDIKPSNLVYQAETGKLSLIDWGSAVYAQQDTLGRAIFSNALMADDQSQTNARMGDVYFIGDEQLNGALSSPRFDEQGAAATLYALASGQASRFGASVVSPLSLGLPVEFARILAGMLSPDTNERHRAADYFFNAMARSHLWHVPALPQLEVQSKLPVWIHHSAREVESVSYSSRKSFLRENQAAEPIADINDFQLDKYYRNFLAGMGDKEKGFIAAVSRLSHYPMLGGLVLRWKNQQLLIDSSLSLYDPQLKHAFSEAVNNMVDLARGIDREGVFKACFFNARDTQHIERESAKQAFIAPDDCQIPFDVSDVPLLEDESRLHSYFEDGPDPDENLALPPEIMSELGRINQIHHTGCIIFEALPTHLKIHSYLRLLNPRKQAAFRQSLDRILSHVDKIKGIGVSGFMKLPYKNTREFAFQPQTPERFYPKNPKAYLAQLD
ncbi:protein kinase domain-containing protein [Paraferrimonas sedimenticola]|uniref:Serine/threonine protein kinase n=1 Tax=Paraferrimonas sedimenticola TaxID=375674 RepID=A0AA37RZC1_9GAMM|nr:protein kinase [Paraferrimonas sedimenticola]GLP97297.1 serine/threonine protein kinase [Paraferrimonas sedimenticola]